MKNIIIIIACIVMVLVFSTNSVDAKTKYNNSFKAKKTKVVKINKMPKNIKGKKLIYVCPCCDGTNNNCVYWIHNENRHMTEEEIVDFEYWEWHYIDEEGNVHEK